VAKYGRQERMEMKNTTWQFASNIESLNDEELAELNQIYIDYSKLKEIQPWFSKLTNLKGIKLSSIEENVSLNGFEGIADLTDLESLSLSADDNKTLRIPAWLEKMPHLKILELDGITEFPECLRYCFNLRELTINFHNIPMFPENPIIMNHLETLVMENLDITELPEKFFDGFSSLKELDLSRSKLRKLPDRICKLSNLESLDLSDTQIEELPKNIGNLKNLTELKFGSEILNLPDSILKCKSLAIHKIKHISVIHGIRRFISCFLDGRPFILSLKKKIYQYMYRRLDSLQEKLDVCGWHMQRGLSVCRKNHNKCCVGRRECKYLGNNGCRTKSLSCKMWLCKPATEYLEAIQANHKNPLYKACVKYLQLRNRYNTLCIALNIPMKVWASVYDTLYGTYNEDNDDNDASYVLNMYIDRWYDNVLLHPWGNFSSAKKIALMRTMTN
jgi:Leucine-rich repeat (LRR) protein